MNWPWRKKKLSFAETAKFNWEADTNAELRQKLNELAKQYTINPATAAKGINLLVDEGILYKKRGIGMFVAEGAKEHIIEKRRDAFYENYVKGLLEEAKSLGISSEQLVEMIRTHE